ncbi:transposable element Tcb2 transposase [Trichonephila clavipes]|nr:transposable element Tcb2 transposase [Trichonephila clavipes]
MCDGDFLLRGPNALYQQDNTRKHTSHINQRALQDMKVFIWPPFSPDLSPITQVYILAFAARVAMNCLTACQTLPWPARSPDLSSIEHVWDMMGRSPDLNLMEHLWNNWEQGVKCHHTAPTNFTELCTALANIRQVIPVERFQKLVESMPRRVAAVIKAGGGPTRY